MGQSIEESGTIRPHDGAPPRQGSRGCARIALAAEGGDAAIVEELRSNPSYRTAPADVVHQLLVRSGVESGRADALMDEADLSRDGARSASAAAPPPAAPAAPATPTRRTHARARKRFLTRSQPRAARRPR